MGITIDKIFNCAIIYLAV